MSALFTAASSMRITTPSTLGPYPLTVGMWVYPISSGDRTQWSLADTAGTGNFFRIRHGSSNWTLSAGTNDIDIGTVTLTQWAFILGRLISATNRRLSVLQYNGSIAVGQDTTSYTPTGIDTMALGALVRSSVSNFADGRIAEWWIADADIQEDGEELATSTLHLLARAGPFALPHIRKNIVEYRSFKYGPTSHNDDQVNVYSRGSLSQWTNTNGVVSGPHVPLPYWYRKPSGQRRTNMVV